MIEISFINSCIPFNWEMLDMEEYYGEPTKRMRLGACSNTITLTINDNNTSCCGLVLDDLTDDELIEILVKLPVKLLHQFKSVSKRWLSLISAPSFARSYIVTHHLSSTPPSTTSTTTTTPKLLLFEFILAGVRDVCALPLVDHPTLAHPSSLPLSSFDFVPAVRQDNYDYHYGVSPCSTGVFQRMLRGVRLQGICGGLVLLKAEFQDATHTTPYSKNPIYCIFYVCDPLTKLWVQLPIPPTDIEDARVGFASYYLRQGQEKDGQVGKKTRFWADDCCSSEELVNHIADYNPTNIEFSTLYVTKDGKHDVFSIYFFDSSCDIACWRKFEVPFPNGYSWPKAHAKTKSVFLNGVFFWDGIDCVVAYDPFNKPNQCDIIPQPPLDYPEVNHPVLFKFMATTCEGRLRMGRNFSSGRFVGWELVDYANKKWALTYDFKVKDLGLFYYDVWFQSFTGAAGDKAYLVDDTNFSIMLFDLRKGSVQTVYSLPRGDADYNKQSFLNVIPCQLSSWPTRVSLKHEE